MKRDEAVLLDLARACRLILEFKEGMDKATFLAACRRGRTSPQAGLMVN